MQDPRSFPQADEAFSSGLQVFLQHCHEPELGVASASWALQLQRLRVLAEPPEAPEQLAKAVFANVHRDVSRHLVRAPPKGEDPEKLVFASFAREGSRLFAPRIEVSATRGGLLRVGREIELHHQGEDDRRGGSSGFSGEESGDDAGGAGKKKGNKRVGETAVYSWRRLNAATRGLVLFPGECFGWIAFGFGPRVRFRPGPSAPVLYTSAEIHQLPQRVHPRYPESDSRLFDGLYESRSYALEPEFVPVPLSEVLRPGINVSSSVEDDLAVGRYLRQHRPEIYWEALQAFAKEGGKLEGTAVPRLVLEGRRGTASASVSPERRGVPPSLLPTAVTLTTTTMSTTSSRREASDLERSMPVTGVQRVEAEAQRDEAADAACGREWLGRYQPELRPSLHADGADRKRRGHDNEEGRIFRTDQLPVGSTPVEDWPISGRGSGCRSLRNWCETLRVARAELSELHCEKLDARKVPVPALGRYGRLELHFPSSENDDRNQRKTAPWRVFWAAVSHCTQPQSCIDSNELLWHVATLQVPQTRLRETAEDSHSSSSSSRRGSSGTDSSGPRKSDMRKIVVPVPGVPLGLEAVVVRLELSVPKSGGGLHFLNLTELKTRPLIRRRPPPRARGPGSRDRRPPNIYLLILDGVSRVALRHFAPKTAALLELGGVAMEVGRGGVERGNIGGVTQSQTGEDTEEVDLVDLPDFGEERELEEMALDEEVMSASAEPVSAASTSPSRPWKDLEAMRKAASSTASVFFRRFHTVMFGGTLANTSPLHFGGLAWGREDCDSAAGFQYFSRRPGEEWRPHIMYNLSAVIQTCLPKPGRPIHRYLRERHGYSTAMSGNLRNNVLSANESTAWFDHIYPYVLELEEGFRAQEYGNASYPYAMSWRKCRGRRSWLDSLLTWNEALLQGYQEVDEAKPLWLYSHLKWAQEPSGLTVLDEVLRAHLERVLATAAAADEGPLHIFVLSDHGVVETVCDQRRPFLAVLLPDLLGNLTRRRHLGVSKKTSRLSSPKHHCASMSTAGEETSDSSRSREDDNTTLQHGSAAKISASNYTGDLDSDLALHSATKWKNTGSDCFRRQQSDLGGSTEQCREGGNGADRGGKDRGRSLEAEATRGSKNICDDRVAEVSPKRDGGIRDAGQGDGGTLEEGEQEDEEERRRRRQRFHVLKRFREKRLTQLRRNAGQLVTMWDIVASLRRIPESALDESGDEEEEQAVGGDAEDGVEKKAPSLTKVEDDDGNAAWSALLSSSQSSLALEGSAAPLPPRSSWEDEEWEKEEVFQEDDPGDISAFGLEDFLESSEDSGGGGSSHSLSREEEGAKEVPGEPSPSSSSSSSFSSLSADSSSAFSTPASPVVSPSASSSSTPSEPPPEAAPDSFDRVASELRRLQPSRRSVLLAVPRLARHSELVLHAPPFAPRPLWARSLNGFRGCAMAGIDPTHCSEEREVTMLLCSPPEHLSSPTWKELFPAGPSKARASKRVWSALVHGFLWSTDFCARMLHLGNEAVTELNKMLTLAGVSKRTRSTGPTESECAFPLHFRRVEQVFLEKRKLTARVVVKEGIGEALVFEASWRWTEAFRVFLGMTQLTRYAKYETCVPPGVDASICVCLPRNASRGVFRATT